MSSNDRFAYLLDLYVSGNASLQEREELFDLLASGRHDARLEDHISQSLAGNDASGAELPPHISQEIVRNILNAEKNTAAIIPMSRNRFGWRKVAAGILLIAGLATAYLLWRPQPAGNEFSAQIKGKTHEQKNQSDTLQQIALEDGSRVTLHPGTTLYYPAHFSDTAREVYMDGSAFFDIAPNAHKPFLVYGRHIITRVLGTSFLISTDPQTGNEEVSVRTGRVQVSENTRVVKESTALLSPVIITPNQKAVYEPGKRALLTTLVAQPQLVHKEVSQEKVQPAPSFQYEQKSLDYIFSDLARAYGVKIITDNAALEKCLFTGDISGNDLFTQLKIICLATHSSYELNGTRILVKGQGCE
ncbi:MAG: FecR domain-containing protein [Chitinophagaceae bacterium]